MNKDTPPQQVKDEKFLQEEEQILESARALFERYGYKKTTLDDIAEASHKAKSSLYYYFHNKESLFKRVLSLEVESIFHTIKESMPDEGSASERLTAYTDRVYDLGEEYVKRHGLILAEFSNYRDILQEDLGKFSEKNALLLGNILAEGCEAQEFSVRDIETTVFLILRCCFTSWTDHILGISPSFTKEKLHKIVSLIVDKS